MITCTIRFLQKVNTLIVSKSKRLALSANTTKSAAAPCGFSVRPTNTIFSERMLWKLSDLPLSHRIP